MRDYPLLHIQKRPSKDNQPGGVSGRSREGLRVH